MEEFLFCKVTNSPFVDKCIYFIFKKNLVKFLSGSVYYKSSVTSSWKGQG